MGKILTDSVPDAVLWIFYRLKDSGFDTWIVGGAVRDTILGKPVEDWDLATLARPQEICDMFPRTVPIGIEHGTVGVMGKDGVLYEVTTFRKDIENFGRKAKVEFAKNIEDDLARRDFTFNALAWSPDTDRILDPFEGRKHLGQGLLKTVGSAKERFSEDLLRVLRALRFAGQLELKIDTDTWNALLETVPELHKLSSERVQEEMIKTLGKSKSPSATLNYYAVSGVMGKLYPEFCFNGGNNESGMQDFTKSVRACDKVSPSRPLLRLALLLSSIGPDQNIGPEAVRTAVENLMHRLRFSKSDTRRTATMVWAALLEIPEEDAKQCRIWLNQVGPHQFKDLCRMWIAEARIYSEISPEKSQKVLSRIRFIRGVLESNPPLRLSDLAVDGTDLQNIGLESGRQLGEMLIKLLSMVLDDPNLNSRQKLLNIAGDLEKMEGKNVYD